MGDTLRIPLSGLFACALACASAAELRVPPAETVVFTHPNGAPVLPQFKTGRPEQAMPFGAGNLSAMVSFGTDTLELHLSRTDYILSAKRDATRWLAPDLPSPGHVSLRFPGLVLTGFRQVMDVERGEVRLVLKSASGEIGVTCSGDHATGALVVEVSSPKAESFRGLSATYSCGRLGEKAKYPDSKLEQTADGWAFSECDLRSGRFYETRTAFVRGRLVIASSTASSAAAVRARAEETASRALATDAAVLEQRRLRWWRDFWSRSHVELVGDPRAVRLAQLWRINLYCWGNVGYGELPPKFNGGPGLVFGDSRKWGAGFWWQNTRELIWPMAAANHPEFALSSLRLYDVSLGRLKADWGAKGTPFEGFDGRYLPETMELESHPLTDRAAKLPRPDRTRPFRLPDYSVRTNALARRAKENASFTSHVYSSGTEYVQQLVEYVRYTGDISLVPVIADWTREHVDFYLGMLERESDGKWHLKCTNVNESWWQVDDSIVDLCGIRFVFTLALVHGREWGYPEELLAAAKERLANLAPFPTADSFRIPPISPTNDYRMIVRDLKPGDRRWTPTWLREGMDKRAYAPNEIYIVYPFNMTHANEDGPDRDRAVNAYYELREECDFTGGDNYYLGYWGWDHLPVAAVRLGLPGAAEEVWRHVERTFRWPFGGAKSPAGVMYEGCEVEDAPYFDGSGVMMLALQEMLLQSQNEEPDPSLLTGGVIKLLPSVPRTWSGSFKLCARGGFVVECRFALGRVEFCRITSTRGGELRYQDPRTGRVRSLKTLPKGQSVLME